MNTTLFLSFDELSLNYLYDVIALRIGVFSVEQQCFYQDLDYNDQSAKHILMLENEQLIAYARVLPYNDGESMSFGRLVTAFTHRGQGLGRKMMDCVMNYLQLNYPNQAIVITAQHYLLAFYQQYGFEAQGEPFQMDGLPHILMKKHR